MWGERYWALVLDSPRPGLRSVEQPGQVFLGLAGVAARGRQESGALGATSLVGVEVVRSRVEATYEPPGWDGLRIRASWSPAEAGSGVDLEVQAVASSVGALKAVEVFVATNLADASGSSAGEDSRPSIVQPRDRLAAGLTYDGRESLADLAMLTTLPVPRSEEAAFGPLEQTLDNSPGGSVYVEMVHPHDVSRRIMTREHKANSLATLRHGLFGHDLEKGVVIRGRLRGLWMPEANLATVQAALDRFLTEPPPLGM